MVKKETIDEFLAQSSLAIVGISRDGKKFGNYAFRDIKTKGYTLYIIHPNAEQLEGQRCYPDFKSLPEIPGGVLVVVSPIHSEQVVKAAAEAGIRRIWLQPGAESQNAIRYCEEQGLSIIYGECIMMYIQPTSFIHKLHRWIKGLSGKMPK